MILAPGSAVQSAYLRLSEIFGNERMISGIAFRKVHIRGPGLVTYAACQIDGSVFFGNPAAQFINPDYCGGLLDCAYQFVRCTFLDCTFSSVLHIINLAIAGPDAKVWRVMPDPTSIRAEA